MKNRFNQRLTTCFELPMSKKQGIKIFLIYFVIFIIMINEHRHSFEIMDTTMEKLKNEFTQKEVAEALGMNPQAVSFLANRRVVIPEIYDPPPGRGRGKPRKYSRRNLIEILLAKELSKHRVPLEKIKRTIDREVVIGDYMHARTGKKYDTQELKDWGKKYLDPSFLENHRLFIHIYDSHTENMGVYLIKSDFDKNDPNEYVEQILLMDYRPSKKELKHTSALVIDVTALYEKIQKI